jgi:uncharacterized protein (DUF983 family)
MVRRKKKVDNNEADCIASGYEFTCPACSALNKLVEYPGLSRFCSYCGKLIYLRLPEHALE